MPPSHTTTELEEPGATRLLEETSLARLAYVGSDGAPTVVPVGFLWDGQRVVVCTATTAPKVVAIRRSPRVAVEIEGGQGAEQLLLIKGDAVIDIVDGVADEYLAMSRRTMTPDDAEQFATFRKRIEQFVEFRKELVRRGIEVSPAAGRDTAVPPAPA